ncbi:hybrid sensor histidine kinase/response regulator transcription factor [Breznakibacter xylanolyticus]|nr:hybrid sensor histidine kinase/response regulator transcription factor [Breznakibacter xylanolyticus]
MTKQHLIALLILIYTLPLFSQEERLRFDHLTVDDGLAQNTIIGISEDKYGFMWFGSWNGLCRYDGYRFKIYQTIDNDSNSIITNRISHVYTDSLLNVWVSFSNYAEVCRYNYEQDNFTRFPREKVKKYISDSLSRYKPFVQSVAQTNNYLWQIKFQDKLLVQTNRNTHKSITYLPDPLNPWSINDEITNEVYLDKNGILWVGTISNGINKADTKQKAINYYYRNNNKNSIIGSEVRAICKDNDGNIWVGTRDMGVTKIDRTTNQYTHFSCNDLNASNRLISNLIRKSHCDRLGDLWFGAKDGLSRYNPRTHTFTNYSTNSLRKIPDNSVYEITEDHNGDLWIGTLNGIAKYDRSNDRFIAFDPQTTLTNPRVRAIVEDQKHNLWVATEGGGLTCLRRDSTTGFDGKFYPGHFRHSANDVNTISSDFIYSMDIDEDGLLWIGTWNGLNRFDPSNGQFTRITIKQGLPDGMIMGVLCDRKGHVWVSHKKGISRINTKTLAMSSYTRQDGLQDNEFSENACFRDHKTGEIFFGGIHGFNSFFPENMKDNPYLPKIYMTGLQILNTPIVPNQPFDERIVLTKPLYLSSEVTLTHNDKTLALEFTALHYSNPQGNKYKYMLEGFDKDWIYTDATQRVAYYSNLEPRTYTFKVMAANCDGVWNPTPATLKINMLPPWWRTTWAYAIWILLLFALGYITYRIIVAREKLRHQIDYERLKAEKIEELDQLKSQFFTNVAHEFRTPLSLIIDPLERLISDSPSLAKAQSYYSIMHRNAKRLFNLSNQLLDFRKMETGHMQLTKSVNDIVLTTKTVCSSFEIQALQRNINYTFQTKFDGLLVSFDPDKFDKILYNLISNAFKYTPDNGEITVELALADNKETNSTLEITVRDNGIGIAAESLDKVFDIFYQADNSKEYKDKGYGVGLAFTKELVILHGGIITVESEPGIGSCFKISFPYIPIHENLSPSSDENVMSSTSGDEGLSSGKDEATTPVDKSKSAPVVLLVEDNNDIRNYLANELSSNYLIYESSNGLDGFDKAIDCLPDLIISDVMMPGMTGIELCKKIKTDERTSHIPVILLTARQSEEYIVEGYQTGADAYITKPFSTVVLHSRINNLIESRQKLREMFGKGSFIDPKILANNVTDEAFIKKVMKIIEDNLSETDFDTETLATKLKMSRALLYKKIKVLTNQTVHDFVTTIRMNKAAELLLAGEYSISEVAYKVGFTVVGNFSRSFTKQFGLNPTNYILKHKKGKLQIDRNKSEN